MTRGATQAQLKPHSLLTRTSAATRMRMKRYDDYINQIRPSLRKAQKHGAHHSVTIAEYLNLVIGIHAPNGKPWNKGSVLRALRRLKVLKLLGPSPSEQTFGYADEWI